MAHMIVENHMVSSGNKKPWHDRGVVLPDDLLTSEQVIRAAGMNRTVVKTPLFAQMNSMMIPVAGKWATVVQETGEVLGVVGDDYEVLQDWDAFTFFDDIVGSGQAVYETAGYLYNAQGASSRMWLLARIPRELHYGGREDTATPYMLLYHGHDGMLAVRVMWTAVRVVCNNTVRMALSYSRQALDLDDEVGAGRVGMNIDQVYFKHTGDMAAKLEQAKLILGVTEAYYAKHEEVMRHLASVKMDDNQAGDYFLDLFGSDSEDAMTRDEKKLDKLFDLREREVEMAVNGLTSSINEPTVACAYNAAIEFVQFHSQKRRKDSALESMITGTVGRKTLEAFDSAFEYAQKAA